MGRIDRHDLERLGNSLELTLVEAAEVCFDCISRNRHSFNRIFLVIDENGGDNFIHNHTTGQHLPMRRNMIYFMPGNTDLGFGFHTDMRFISFHFHLEMFGYLNIFAGQNRYAAIRDENNVIPELSAILNTSGWNPTSLCYMRANVLKLAGDFLNAGQPELKRLDEMNNKYATLFEYIRKHADARTSIDDLAAVAKLSRDALSREFSQDCGITLKEYLNRNLTQKAERLLLAPDTTARKVAEQLNFNNEYYFSRFFKKNTGTTTRDYRAPMQVNRPHNNISK